MAKYLSYGYIKFIKISVKLQDFIIINFITKLLKLKDSTTKNKFDAILVIVDKLTKYTILILYKETYNTK